MMNKLVYDIGMHIGQDTEYYLNQDFNVLAVEANPVLAGNAKKKFSKFIETGKLIILNIGVADYEGYLPFYNNLRHSEWSSFDKSCGSKNNTKYEVLEVKCTTTKKLFDKYGIPFYLKVDIEGNDQFCLMDIPEKGEKPKYVSCEVGRIELLDILVSKGYSKFKMISQGDNFEPIDLDKERKILYPYFQIINNIAKIRLQNIIPYKYKLGSSGPFGENSKGNWLTYNEVKDLYLKFYNFHSNKPLNFQSWFDFHATF